MTIVRAVAVALCLVGASNAPAFAQGQTVNAGIEAGVSWSRESPDVRGQTITRAPGLLAGGWVQFQPWVPVGIQIEAVYAQKHMHLSSSSDLKLDYFEIPVLAKLKLFKGIYMLEGIAFGFPVSAKVTHATGDDTDIKSSITSPDIGLVIAGGVPVAPKVSVEFRYEGGFKKVSNVATADTQRLRSLSGIIRIKL
jgi:hypothetical protein